MDISFDSKTIFLITGAFGHLGNVVVRDLLSKGARIRALIHPRDLTDERFSFPIELVRGDLTNIESFKAAFDHEDDESIIVIHMASIISTMLGGFKRLYRTNVVGTKNLLSLALEAKVKRFLYVSSVHALTEAPKGSTNQERTDFDPRQVVGTYAKSKAIASKLVLSYADRLDVLIVHPSGIIGPFDYAYSQTNQVFYDYLRGKLPAIIKGGYDFVDVRDVSDGIIKALMQGRAGNTYLLTGRYITVKDMVQIMAHISGRKMPKTLPLWIAKAVSPFVEAFAKMTRTRPLFTPYSLYTTGSNGLFSYEKARNELGYQPRPIEITIKDIHQWFFDTVSPAIKLKKHQRKKYL